MFRAPTLTPQLCTLLDDLPTRDLGRVARHLGIARSTLTRYKRTGNAPRLVHLALFWETRWGASVIDCDLVNLQRLQRGQIEALERENATLRLQLDKAHELHTGAANESIFAPGLVGGGKAGFERAPQVQPNRRPWLQPGPGRAYR